MASLAVPMGLKGRKPSTSRRVKSIVFETVCIAATVLGILALAALLWTIASDGLSRVSWDFMNSYPSRFADQAGIRSAFLGTLWLMVFTALIAVPIGVGAAIYLEEFAPRNWF